MFNPYLNLILENQYGQKYTLLEIVEELKEYVNNISFDDVEAFIAELEATLSGINDDLDDLAQRIAEFDVSGLKNRMHTAEIDVANLHDVLNGVDADLLAILDTEEAEEMTVPQKVDEIGLIKTALKLAIQSKGGEVPIGTPFEEYEAKVRAIVSSDELTHVQTIAQGEGVDIHGVLFDLICPNYDAQGNPIVSIAVNDGRNETANTPEAVRTIKGGQFLTTVGQYLHDYKNLVSIDCPFATTVHSRAFTNNESLKELHFARLADFELYMSKFASNDGVVLDFPALKNFRSDYAVKNKGTTWDAQTFPALETARGAGASIGTFNGAGEFHFPVLREWLNSFTTDQNTGDEMKLYLPAITKIDVPQFSYNFFVKPTEGALIKVYFGANLATLYAGSSDISDLNTAISAGTVEIHIPEGASTTKTTLDAKGVVGYVQDYDPEA